MIPGTPVEGFIQAACRAVASYLVKPLRDQIVEAFPFAAQARAAGGAPEHVVRRPGYIGRDAITIGCKTRPETRHVEDIRITLGAERATKYGAWRGCVTFLSAKDISKVMVLNYVSKDAMAEVVPVGVTERCWCWARRSDSRVTEPAGAVLPLSALTVRLPYPEPYP